MPFVIFSGFFLLYKDAPFLFKWIFHISFLKHGLVGVVISIFGFDRPKLPCSDFYCHYTFPKQFMMEQGMEQEKYGLAVICLMVIAVVVSLCTYGILKLRLRTRWFELLYLNKTGYYRMNVDHVMIRTLAQWMWKSITKLIFISSCCMIALAEVEFESWDSLKEFIISW